MSLLADYEIEHEIKIGGIKIQPFDKSLLNPNSYDVRICNDILSYNDDSKNLIIDPYNQNTINFGLIRKNYQNFTIKPYEFILARTVEKISLKPHIVCQVQGKSSIGRLGLIVHTVAGYCDSGFEGTITLELFNCNKRPILIHSGMRIAQLTFYTGNESRIPYNEKIDSKYCGQIETTPSKYGENKISKD